MSSERKKLHQLFFPIFFEILFTILTGAVDTLMLSSEGDQAVGAVGTANTYISIFLIMFSIISSGMVAVMTQYIGAKFLQPKEPSFRTALWVLLYFFPE